MKLPRTVHNGLFGAVENELQIPPSVFVPLKSQVSLSTIDVRNRILRILGNCGIKVDKGTSGMILPQPKRAEGRFEVGRRRGQCIQAFEDRNGLVIATVLRECESEFGHKPNLIRRPARRRAQWDFSRDPILVVVHRATCFQIYLKSK